MSAQIWQSAIRPRGGTGIRLRFRTVCRKACGFKSHRGHNSVRILARTIFVKENFYQK